MIQVTLCTKPEPVTHRYNRRAERSPHTNNSVPQSQLKRNDSERDAAERREASDRRHSTFHALLYGSFHPRRRNPRRGNDASLVSVDWHHPQWLGVAVMILLLSCADAFLTLTLIDRGAYEVNPFMAPLVQGSPLAFTVIKIGLTAGGVVFLTLLARMRAFRHVPISLLLYGLLAAYTFLVIYETKLLEEIFFTP